MSIEIEIGTYYGEDDIIRLHDKHGRIDQIESKR